MTRPASILRRVVPDLFVLALVVALALATLVPARGIAAVGVHWLASALIVMLFFFLGAKLSRDAVLAGVRHWRLHVVVLSITFLFFPLLALLLARAVPDALPVALWTGILFVGALPSTVQSSIAFTSIARGNVAAAIASASASQLLGVFLTPLLIGVLVGSHGGTVPSSGLGMIFLQILAPFVVGHLLRPWIGAWVQQRKQTIAITDRGTILVAVYSAFSAAVIDGLWSRLSLPVFGALVAICLVILGAALLTTRTAARRFGFSRADEITIVFCGTKKSLVQGVPMAAALFTGPDLGMILLPIMIFHQLQLVACGSIAQIYARRPSDV